MTHTGTGSAGICKVAHFEGQNKTMVFSHIFLDKAASSPSEEMTTIIYNVTFVLALMQYGHVRGAGKQDLSRIRMFCITNIRLSFRSAVVPRTIQRTFICW